MRCSRVAFVIPIALALLAACVARGTDDPRVVIVPANSFLVAADPNVSRDDNGFMRVVVQISNASLQNINGHFAVQWFDAAHRPVATALSLPRRITVPSQGSSFIDVISPNADAQDFRIRIEAAVASAQQDVVHRSSRLVERGARA